MLKGTEETWCNVLDEYFENRRYLIDDLIEWYPVDFLDVAANFKRWKGLLVHYHDLSSERIDQIVVVDDDYCEDPFTYIDEEEWRFIFGKKLRNKLINRFGIQEDVASEVGLSRISLNRYCSGKATPSLYNINKLSNYLRISMSEFYIPSIEQSRTAVVRPNEFWDEVIDDIKYERPDIAEAGIGWYPVCLHELTIRTKSDDRYLYDTRDHRFVYIYNGRSGKWNEWGKWIKLLDDTFIDEVEWREVFSERLTLIMKKAGITREELAYKSGISSISIYSYMVGKTTPSLYNATRIVRVLGCSLTDFQVMVNTDE